MFRFLCFALAGASLGFLRYNYYPARVFLGDTGSMLLGLLLSAIALASARKSSTAIALLMPLVSLGVPVLDTCLAIIRRSSTEGGIFRADGEHLHHRLLRLGVSHEDVVKLFYFVSVWLGLVAFTFVLIPNQYSLIVFAVLGMGLLFAIKSLTFLEAAMLGRPKPKSLPLSTPLRWFSQRFLERPAQGLERGPAACCRRPASCQASRRFRMPRRSRLLPFRSQRLNRQRHRRDLIVGLPPAGRSVNPVAHRKAETAEGAENSIYDHCEPCVLSMRFRRVLCPSGEPLLRHRNCGRAGSGRRRAARIPCLPSCVSGLDRHSPLTTHRSPLLRTSIPGTMKSSS
jgi:hypothetical protein